MQWLENQWPTQTSQTFQFHIDDMAQDGLAF